MSRNRIEYVEAVVRAVNTTMGMSLGQSPKVKAAQRVLFDFYSHISNLIANEHMGSPAAALFLDGFGAQLADELAFKVSGSRANPSSSEDPVVHMPSMDAIAAAVELAEEGFPPTTDDVDF